MLTESYRNKLLALAGINESKTIEYEYQIRDIGGPVFYRRKKGDRDWNFISPEDFAEKACDSKIIKWDESK